MQRSAEQMKKLAEAIKPQFGERYRNPFESLCYTFERGLAELRKDLIEDTVSKFRFKYMPNSKPDIDFKKLMDEKVGEQGNDDSPDNCAECKRRLKKIRERKQ